MNGPAFGLMPPVVDSGLHGPAFAKRDNLVGGGASETMAPITVNHPENAAIAASVARGLVGKDKVDMDCPPDVGGEDLSCMLQRVPEAHMFIGHGDSSGLHNAAYDFNDEIIPPGCAHWIESALARCAAREERAP